MKSLTERAKFGISLATELLIGIGALSVVTAKAMNHEIPDAVAAGGVGLMAMIGAGVVLDKVFGEAPPQVRTLPELKI